MKRRPDPMLVPNRDEYEALLRLAEAVRTDRENYVSGPAARAALAEYEAVKR